MVLGNTPYPDLSIQLSEVQQPIWLKEQLLLRLLLQLGVVEPQLLRQLGHNGRGREKSMNTKQILKNIT